MKGKKRSGGNLYLSFLELEKAHDSVDRGVLCRVLERVGLTEKFVVNIIKSMYVGTRVLYRLVDLETGCMKRNRG